MSRAARDADAPRMRLLPLAVAFLALASCASSPEPVALEWHGSDAGFAMAQEAANEWWSVCHAAIWVDRVGGAPLNEVAAPFDGHSGLTITDGSTGQVEVMQVAVYADERTTLAHEMGHALGLGHQPSGVMAVWSKRGPGLFHVTPADCP